MHFPYNTTLIKAFSDVFKQVTIYEEINLSGIIIKLFLYKRLQCILNRGLYTFAIDIFSLSFIVFETESITFKFHH